MSRRPGRVLEQLPHFVYIHLDAEGDAIYVGRTCDPESRPHDARRRPWIKTESRRVEVSPAMSFEAASWAERALIRAHLPKHNTRPGQTLNEGAGQDWRIDRIAEAEGVTRATARWAANYYPTDPEEFEEALEARVRGVRDLQAEAERRGVDPMQIVTERLSQWLSDAGVGQVA